MTSSPDLADLSQTYADAVDRADGVAVAALFTPSGRMHVHAAPPSSDVVVLEGRAEIAERIGALRRYERTHHVVGAHQSETDDEHATGTTECVAHHIGGAAGAGMDRVVHIRYEDVYQCDGGGWRFVDRHVVMLKEEAVPADA